MRDYRAIDERLEFTPRMVKVREDVLPRLYSRHYREDTMCSPVEPDGKDPFMDEFLEHPDRPYIINLANGIVRSWMVTPFIIFPHEAVVGITRPIYPNIEHFSEGLRGTEAILERKDLTPDEAKALKKRLRPLD